MRALILALFFFFGVPLARAQHPHLALAAGGRVLLAARPAAVRHSRRCGGGSWVVFEGEGFEAHEFVDGASHGPLRGGLDEPLAHLE